MGARSFEGAVDAADRFALWEAVLRERAPRTMAEVGVYRGEFAARILRAVPSIERYVLIDPWRQLPQWNKPYNTDDSDLDAAMAEALERVAFAGERVQVLRGTTAEVVDQLDDASLDVVYVDADHTLRGITLDLTLMGPKVAPDGLLGGDDFRPSVWQHDRTFEPTFVFPYAVYAAEAFGHPIHALGHHQFAIDLGSDEPFGFHDHTGTFTSVEVLDALGGPPPAATRRRDPASLGRAIRRRLPR
jgi:predicted O-methyltransferase YrrM